MKKTLLLTAVFAISLASAALGYVAGGSNLGFGGYPEFREYLSHNPSRNDVEYYIQKAKDYVENGNNDIRRVKEAQDEAIEKANKAVSDYNRKQKGY